MSDEPFDKIVTGDCVTEMAKLPAGCARVVFADPPFNIGYSYDKYDDNRTSADYLKWAGEWVRAAARLVAADGSLWVAIGDEYAAEYKSILDATGFTLRNWLIWRYGFGVQTKEKFSRCHAHIFYYVRDPKNFVFRPDRVKVTSAREAEYGDNRAAPGGKVPPDVWDFPRVAGTFGERVKVAGDSKTAHPCQMPEALLERVILCASEPGDVVADPFGGSGTTAVAAKRHGRRFWASELSPEYAEVIRARLSALPIFADDDDASLSALADELGLT